MSTQSTSVRTKVVVGIVVVIVAALVVALFVGGSDDSGSNSSTSSAAVPGGDAGENQPVSVVGSPLPQFSNPREDPAVGQNAPSLTGLSFDGSPVSVTPGDGRAHMIVFLAHWCPHCNAEVPRLVKWYESGNVPEGLDVVGVSTAVASDRPNYPPSEWTRATGWPWKMMADSTAMEAAAAYGVSGFPYFAIVGEDGKVKVRVSGEVELDVLEKIVAAALAN